MPTSSSRDVDVPKSGYKLTVQSGASALYFEHIAKSFGAPEEIRLQANPDWWWQRRQMLGKGKGKDEQKEEEAQGKGKLDLEDAVDEYSWLGPMQDAGMLGKGKEKDEEKEEEAKVEVRVDGYSWLGPGSSGDRGDVRRGSWVAPYKPRTWEPGTPAPKLA